MLTTFLMTWAFADWLDASHLGDAWVLSSVAVLPCAVVLFLSRYGGQLGCPVRDFRSAYRYTDLISMIAYFVLWQLYSVLHAGDAAPFDYIPVLNPLELAGILCLAEMTTRGLAQSQAGHEFSARALVRLIAGLGFVRCTIS